MTEGGLSRRARLLLAAVLIATVVMIACALDCPDAHAATSASVKTAHARSVKAATHYTGKKLPSYASVEGNHKGQKSVIYVDVSDLHLTRKQAQQATDWMYYEGEYFWLDTLGTGHYIMDAQGKYASQLVYRCFWKDSTITQRRKDFNRAVKAALRYAKGAKTASARIHRLHDWIVLSSTWYYKGTSSKKTAYNCLVLGKGDCAAYSLGMGVLLQRAGYKTAMCYNEAQWHQWNMVRIGKKWYHVDSRWDDAWSYNKKYFWPSDICHYWVLTCDAHMKRDEHKGWVTFYQGAQTKSVKATSKKYEDVNWAKSCKWAKSFKVGMYGYKVTGKGKVKVVKVYARGRSSYSVPKKVAYGNKKYKVAHIKKSRLKKL